MNRNYVIIDVADVPSANFSQILETSAATLRYNIAGDKAFVKHEGATPSFLAGKESFNHSEILAILSGEEWTQQGEEL